MKNSALGRIPEWYKEEKLNNDLILSDDIDGLVSCAILKECKGWDVQYFYDFEHLYISDVARDKSLDQRHEDRVWVDVSILLDEKCFDNHVNQKDYNDWQNPFSINPNHIRNVTNWNYTSKYAGSTALMLWSLYDLPLPSTEEGKMLLLSIDSSFKGFYKSRYEEKTKDMWMANKYYIENLFEFPELYELQKQHDIEDFYSITRKYSADPITIETKKIKFEDGYLNTDLDCKAISEALEIDVTLPEKRFEEIVKLETVRGYWGNKYIQDLPQNYLTAAYTYQGKISASYVLQ